MSKALYLRSERDVNRYLVTAMVAGTIFTSVLLVGLFARLTLGGDLAPDRVMATYIATDFSPGLKALIMLGVLAAGFSTLEGVILALSAIFANDLYGNLARFAGVDPETDRPPPAAGGADLPGGAGPGHLPAGAGPDSGTVVVGGDLRPERGLRTVRRHLRTGGVRDVLHPGDQRVGACQPRYRRWRSTSACTTGRSPSTTTTLPCRRPAPLSFRP